MKAKVNQPRYYVQTRVVMERDIPQDELPRDDSMVPPPTRSVVLAEFKKDFREHEVSKVIAGLQGDPR